MTYRGLNVTTRSPISPYVDAVNKAAEEHTRCNKLSNANSSINFRARTLEVFPEQNRQVSQTQEAAESRMKRGLAVYSFQMLCFGGTKSQVEASPSSGQLANVSAGRPQRPRKDSSREKW
ncbi:hypothetical protein GE21DRAFT_1291969 [Neurospora crassa]|nr:hypothetical protein GE21DRAFT_1291969 [Neurospora crassa]